MRWTSACGATIAIATITVATNLLVSCSGSATGGGYGSGQPPAGLLASTSQNTAIESAASSHAAGLYAATGSVVSVYKVTDRGNEGPFCSIILPENAFDIGIDSRGHLWAPTSNAANGTITEYGQRCGPSGRQSVLRTLVDLDGRPAGVAIDSKGTVYVNNISGPSSSPGNVVVYPPGARYPSNLLTPLSDGLVTSIAADADDNIYVTYGPAGYSIEEFPKGAAPGVQLNISAPPSELLCPSGIVFDANQNLVVINTCIPYAYVYAPPYSGVPIRTIALHSAHGGWQYGALSKKNDYLYVGAPSVPAIDVYAYPSGKYVYTITSGLHSTGEIGIALDPAGSK